MYESGWYNGSISHSSSIVPMQWEHLGTVKTTFSSFGAARTKFNTVLQLVHWTICEVCIFLLHSGQMNPRSPGFSSGWTKKIELHFVWLHLAKCHLIVSVFAITISIKFVKRMKLVLFKKSIEKCIPLKKILIFKAQFSLNCNIT